MKTIDPQADRFYMKWKAVQVAADKLKEELKEYMASLPEGHTSAYCSYVQPSKTFDRSVAAIMAMNERIEIPTKIVQDWSRFHKDIKGRIDFKGLCDNYPIYKEKAGYIRSEKKVA